MSDVGLTVWDDQGRIVFDTTSSLVKFFGLATIGGNINGSGTIVDSRFLLGTPYWILNIDSANLEQGWAPTISITGDTLTWNYSSRNQFSTYSSATVLYGIY